MNQFTSEIKGLINNLLTNPRIERTLNKGFEVLKFNLTYILNHKLLYAFILAGVRVLLRNTLIW